QARYWELACRLGVAEPSDLQPREHASETDRWIYPIMERVIEGIERGNLACIELGVEFIEQDQTFPFGRRLKSNTARALRRAELTEDQKERICKRVIAMLVAGHVPREYRQYARLARKAGLADWWAQAQGRVNVTTPHVRRYYHYFTRHVVGPK